MVNKSNEIFRFKRMLIHRNSKSPVWFLVSKYSTLLVCPEHFTQYKHKFEFHPLFKSYYWEYSSFKFLRVTTLDDKDRQHCMLCRYNVKGGVDNVGNNKEVE